MTRIEGYYRPEYTDPNSTVADAAWDALNIGHGVVALDTSFARAKGLPPSRSFIKDRSKSVYYLAAYHGIHCLVGGSDPAKVITDGMKGELRSSIKDHFRDGKAVKEHDWAHATHCLEVLREEIMCSADGTISSSRLDPKDRSIRMRPGYEDTRVCADWVYLRDWAVGNPSDSQCQTRNLTDHLDRVQRWIYSCFSQWRAQRSRCALSWH